MDLKRQRGMTLIELVLVLLVMGILSGMATVKFGSASSMTISSQAQLFASHVRQVQTMAQNWGCNMKLVVSGSTYTATANGDYSASIKAANCGDGATPVKTPGRRESFSFSLDHGVTFSAGGAIYFDVMGRPSDNTNTPIAAYTSFQLSESGNTFQVQISPITGFTTVIKL